LAVSLCFGFLLLGSGRGIGGRCIGDRGRDGGIGGGLLVLVVVLSMTIDKLDTDLLGESQLDGLTGGGGELGDALLKGLGDILNLGDGDALLLSEVLAADSWEADGLVHTGLDGLGVGDLNGGLNNGDNGDIVTGLLGNLIAVVVAVSTMSITVSMGSRLADGNHLGLALLGEANLNSLSGGVLALGLVVVSTDFVVNDLNRLGADGSGDGVALLLVNNSLPHKLNGAADSLKGGSADLSGLNNISDCAVVLGLLITISRGVVVSRGSMVGGGSVVSRGCVVGGSSVISWGGVIGTIGRGGMAI